MRSINSVIVAVFAVVVSLALFLGANARPDNSLNDDLTTLCAASSCVDYNKTLIGDNRIPSYSDGVRIAAKDWGPKKKGAVTLLFLHGYPHGQGLWISQVLDKSLRGNFRLVTMDTRGSGFSDVPAAGHDEAFDYGSDIQAVIDRLGLKNVILVAHSYGGILVTGYVSTYGVTQIKGIVWAAALFDLPHTFIPPSTLNVLFGTVDPDPVVREAATQLFVEISHAPNPIRFSPEFTSRIFNMDMQTSYEGRLGHLTSAFFNSDNSAIVQAITVPSLVIQGENDVVIPPVNSDTLQANLLSSKKVSRVNLSDPTYGVGHIPMLEVPAAFNKALSKFASDL